MKEIRPGLSCEEQFLTWGGLGADLGGTTFKIGETQGLTLLTKKTIQQASEWAAGPEKFARTIVDRWVGLALQSDRTLKDYRFFSAAMCGPTNSITGTVLRITNRGSELWQRRCFRQDLINALIERGVAD